VLSGVAKKPKNKTKRMQKEKLYIIIITKTGVLNF
jgi:hypothetical protein